MNHELFKKEKSEELYLQRLINSTNIFVQDPRKPVHTKAIISHRKRIKPSFCLHRVQCHSSLQKPLRVLLLFTMSENESINWPAKLLGSSIRVWINACTTLRSCSVDLKLNQVKNFILNSCPMCPSHSSHRMIFTQYS